MSAIFYNKKKDSNERDWLGRANVVLYLCDTPVISLQQGTTFGLTKILHESMGGNGQIIGLRKRQRSSPLACIVTLDQTVLIEGEYDIILKEKPWNVFPDSTLSIYPDKNVTSGISLQSERQLWRRDMFPIARHMTWKNEVGDNSDSLQRRARNCHPSNGNDDTQEDNDSNSAGENNDTAQKQQLKNSAIHTFQHRRTRIRKDIMIEYAENDRVAAVSPVDSCSSSSTDNTNESCQALSKEVEQITPRKRKWQCSHCKKFFRCLSAHNSHKRTHTGEKPFKCDVCGRCFSHNGNMKQHTYIHRDVKPHVCDVCGRGFIRQSRLREHKLSHEYELYMRTKG